jgi:3-oxoadipate enol-lactonase
MPVGRQAWPGALMAIFRAAGRSLHYLIRGSGEPLLLIHGLGSSGADWALQVRALEQRFRLIVPDLPGCGHSEALVGQCRIEDLAASLWTLLDHLEIPSTNIVGFSLGGAVALEMTAQRPDSVPRLALINSLAAYQIDHWRKWLEARLPRLLIFLFGIRLLGRLCAGRMFPHPWQQAMRERAAAVIGAAPPASYLAIISALERWSAIDRLDMITSRILIIAAESDHTPLAEKRLLAVQLGAELVVMRGSRHGTPFDATEATNATLLSMFTDEPLPPFDLLSCDEPDLSAVLSFAGSLAEQHALGPVEHA